VKPTLNWWLEAAGAIGAQHASERGIEFLGSVALPDRHAVDQRFAVGDLFMRVRVDCGPDPKRSFDRARERLDELMGTMPVLERVEPMAVGL
jgi:hypothetical protein